MITMNKKIIISICIAGLLLSALIPISVTANDNYAKVYTGPKIVFDEKSNHDNIINDDKGDNNGKGKPPSNQGE